MLDSAKGFAGTIRLNSTLRQAFTEFYRRSDTFSLGVCNGCQLMTLLGLVPFASTQIWPELASTAASAAPASTTTHLVSDDATQPRFVHNESGRFESRFSTVTVPLTSLQDSQHCSHVLALSTSHERCGKGRRSCFEGWRAVCSAFGWRTAKGGLTSLKAKCTPIPFFSHFSCA